VGVVERSGAMSDIDTNTETVERLAAQYSTYGLRDDEAVAATLRALAAERDALRLREAKAVLAANNAHRERMQSEREARNAEADRDRLAAENANLRRLLARYVNETPIGHQPHMITHEARAALAQKEPDA